jgi:N-acetylmuramoyl-L-alanine amidase
MDRIVIDAGHGGKDPGASYGGLREKDVNLAVVQQMHLELSIIGFDVILTRGTDLTLTLAERCAIANKSGAMAFLSIHCNADPDPDLPGMPEARGEEIWVYQMPGLSYDLAFDIGESFKYHFPLEPWRGIKISQGLYVLRHTRMPAALVEIGFIDASDSPETFGDSQTILKIAHVVDIGILNWSKSAGRSQ